MSEIEIPTPPVVGSHVATGWFPQNYQRARVLTVLTDEPSPGAWVVLVRSWWKRKRRHHYQAIRWVEFACGVWRDSPRAQSWDELAAEARQRSGT